MNELSTLIDALSEKLGIAAGELYSVMQTQARLYTIEGPVWCIFYIGAIIFTVIFLKKVFYDKTRTINDDGEDKAVTLFKYHDEEFNDGRYFFYLFLAAGLSIISIVCFFNAISTFDTVITCIFNPKYLALDKILSYLK